MTHQAETMNDMNDNGDSDFCEPSGIITDIASAMDVSARPPVLYIAMLLASLATGIICRLVVVDAAQNGLNALVFAGVLLTGWFACTRIRSVPRWRKGCAVGALVAAVLSALRDSDILNRVSIFMMLTFLSLAFLPGQASRMKSISGLLMDSFQLLFNYGLGGLMNLLETPWRKFSGGRQFNSHIRRIILGLFISVPFLLVFGLLFASAETSFSGMMTALLNLISFDITDDIFAIGVFAYITFGALRSSFVSVSLSEQVGAKVNDGRWKLGMVESGIVLGLLNALFLAFVITQLPYFFGGQARVTSTAGLAWSEYARKGFFELAVAVALLVPTLLLFLSVTKTETAKQRILLLGLCGALVFLCGIIIISALQRMVLYTANYGLTELRICVTAFIVMLAIILAALMVLSLRNQQEHFVPFVLITGLIFTMMLHGVNIQGWVARDIISRKAKGLSHDIELLKSLSADAVPVILHSNLEATKKQAIVTGIMNRSIQKGQLPGLLERSWSYQRARELTR